MPPKCLRRWTTPVFTKSACPAQKISRFDKCLNLKRVRGTLRLMLRETFSHAFLTFYHVSLDFTRFLGSLLQSRFALAAENLFLRKQLALYQERQVRPRRVTDATRLTMVLLGTLFDWKQALVSVRPESKMVGVTFSRGQGVFRSSRKRYR